MTDADPQQTARHTDTARQTDTESGVAIDLAPAAVNPAEMTFVTRGVSAEEAAAVTAVLAAAIAEGSSAGSPTSKGTPSAWDRGRRSLRSPITPGPGRWRSFTG